MTDQTFQKRWQHRATALVAGTVAALGMLSAAPAVEAKTKAKSSRAVRCESRPNVTAVTTKIVVYERGSSEQYYACRRGSRNRGMKLGGVESVDDSITAVTATGGLAALARRTCPRNNDPGCDGSVRIVDAVSHRTRSTWTAFAPGSVGVGNLVLTPGGTAAWMETTATSQLLDPGTEVVRILHVMSRNGTVTQADAGSDIVPGSLAIARTFFDPPSRRVQNTLYWLKGGEAKSMVIG